MTLKCRNCQEKCDGRFSLANITLCETCMRSYLHIRDKDRKEADVFIKKIEKSPVEVE